MRLSCELTIGLTVSEWTTRHEIFIVKLGHQCQRTTVIVSDRSSADSERRVRWELLRWSIDGVVLLEELRSHDVDEALVDARVLESQIERSLVINCVLCNVFGRGCGSDSDSLSLSERKQVLIVVVSELGLIRDVSCDC